MQAKKNLGLMQLIKKVGEEKAMAMLGKSESFTGEVHADPRDVAKPRGMSMSRMSDSQQVVVDLVNT